MEYGRAIIVDSLRFRSGPPVASEDERQRQPDVGWIEVDLVDDLRVADRVLGRSDPEPVGEVGRELSRRRHPPDRLGVFEDEVHDHADQLTLGRGDLFDAHCVGVRFVAEEAVEPPEHGQDLGHVDPDPQVRLAMA